MDYFILYYNKELFERKGVAFPKSMDEMVVAAQKLNDLVTDERFVQSVVRTFWFTLMATLIPIVIGVCAALIFHRHFPFRGVLRTIFVMPMMATPVAVALVWTMMFHPQPGVLNYLFIACRPANFRMGV
jgi:ABC-type sugar transport system permease subunit